MSNLPNSARNLQPDDLPPQDPFGGLLSGPVAEALEHLPQRDSGYFQLAQSENGAWWFLTPQGKPFWAYGLGDLHLLGPPPSAAEGSLWASRIIENVAQWGFNALGPACEPSVYAVARLPYLLTTPSSTAPPLLRDNLPDVFNPAWSAGVDRQLEQVAANHHRNPWLLGYLISDELPWDDLRLLSAPPKATLRQAWQTFISQQMDSVATFNHFFQTDCADWTAVGQVQTAQIPPFGLAADKVLEFEQVFSHTYFETLRRTLHKYDAIHLFFGCRFGKTRPPERVLDIAGQFSDALVLAGGDAPPEKDSYAIWHDLAGGKPLLIDRFHLPHRTESQPQGLSSLERKRQLSKFVGEWANAPFSVGCFWLPYADDARGFVNQVGEPDPALVSASVYVGPTLYRWHLKSRWFDQKSW